jgi:hypothetical protein
MLLAVQTENFANGCLTRIQGKLYDRGGSLRMEPSFESARVFGDSEYALDAPVRFQEKTGKERSDCNAADEALMVIGVRFFPLTEEKRVIYKQRLYVFQLPVQGM